ncbi:hypothetical protein HDK64DRAFT_270694 [Phyllosticta capitalensis]|uniref:Secreted protein n=1 Tax=Phyllosticta capitalensis TaxID=121624 RepID=A0ABR1YMF1_9PEZI
MEFVKRAVLVLLSLATRLLDSPLAPSWPLPHLLLLLAATLHMEVARLHVRQFSLLRLLESTADLTTTGYCDYQRDGPWTSRDDSGVFLMCEPARR